MNQNSLFKYSPWCLPCFHYFPLPHASSAVEITYQNIFFSCMKRLTLWRAMFANWKTPAAILFKNKHAYCSCYTTHDQFLISFTHCINCYCPFVWEQWNLPQFIAIKWKQKLKTNWTTTYENGAQLHLHPPRTTRDFKQYHRSRTEDCKNSAKFGYNVAKVKTRPDNYWLPDC